MENICYLQMRKIIAIISKINRREAMKKYEIIAVDFDGTLCNDCYPDIGKPNLPLIEPVSYTHLTLPTNSLV